MKTAVYYDDYSGLIDGKYYYIDFCVHLAKFKTSDSNYIYSVTNEVMFNVYVYENEVDFSDDLKRKKIQVEDISKDLLDKIYQKICDKAEINNSMLEWHGTYGTYDEEYDRHGDR